MSKIFWNMLKLVPAVLGACLLVANSTLAAENPAAQMLQEQRSAVITEPTVGLPATIDQSTQVVTNSTPVNQTPVSSASDSLKVSPTQVAANSTPVKQTPVSSASDSLKVSSTQVAANSTPVKQTPVSSASDSLKVSPTPVVANSTPVNQTPVVQNTTAEPTPDALEQNNQDNTVDSNSDPMDQVTNVSQFSDVRPGDWAYEALRELVERYGCIAGYPNGTFRGNRALSRYEFAAGLNACLKQVETKITASLSEYATREDLEKLRRLTQEFQAELATLATRVDKLEGRVGFLEAHQFSTTTKLNAEIIFNVAGFGGSRIAVPSGQPRSTRNLSDNVIFSDRVRLNFDTSFTGKDRLRTRLEANNTTPFSGNDLTGTNETRQSFDGLTGGGNGNSILIGKLLYRFPLTNSTTVVLDATGGEFYDNINTNNPYLETSGLGSISRFGRFSPIYRISNTGAATNTGAGITVVQKFSDNLSFSGGYLARRAYNPLNNSGLFDGTYAAIGQINFQANKAFGIGLTYAHSYYGRNTSIPADPNLNDVGVFGGTGSANANTPFGQTIPTSTNAYGVEASFRVSPFFTISGWGELAYSTAERGNGTTVRKGNHASSYNYAVTLAFPDLGKKGNLAAIIFGQPPKATRNDSKLGNGSAPRRRDRDNAYHIEGLYRYQVSNNVYITPGVLVILNPENYSRNPTEYVGVVRTTFTF